MPLGRCPHDRRLSLAIRCADLGAMLEQRLQWLNSTRASGRHQDCFAATETGVRISTSLEQRPYDVGIPIDARERERRYAIAIGHGDIRTSVQEQLHRR